MRSFKLFSLVACALMMLPAAASAATTNFIAGAGYAAGSLAEATVAEFQTGAGSWYKNHATTPGVVEFYIDPVAQFGTTIAVADIADIRYWTRNDGTNPSGVDYFMTIYTVPDGVDDDGWYGRRLLAEPYLANSYAPAANTWVQWSAASPPQNQLTWFDSNNCGNFGFYGAPTLADLLAGPITWTDYPGAGAGADPDPIDYASETVLYFRVATATGWASFEGYLDAVEFELTNGDVYVFDLEGPADPIYVDDDWAGLPAATEVAPGMWLGYNAYDTIQNGVNFALTQVNVADGTYQEQVLIDKDLAVIGAGAGLSTIVSPAVLDVQFSTSKDYKPVVTASSADVTFQGFTVDGNGQGNANVNFLGVAYYNASGNLTDCEVVGIRNEPLDGGQHGVALYGLHDDGGTHAVNCRDNVLYDFQKNGMAWNSTNGSVVALEVTGNTVTGSPGMTADNGDPAQNGIQVLGSGTTALIDANIISGIGYDNTSAATKWVATSLLTYYCDATISNNTVTSAQTAAYMIEGPVAYLDNDVEVVKYGESGYGIIAADPPSAVPSPVEGPEIPSQGIAKRAGLFDIVLSGNDVVFSGVDNSGSIGMEVDAGYYDFLGDGAEALIVNVTNNSVSGFEIGMGVFECATGCTGSTYTSIDIHDNDFGGNVYGLYTDAFSATVDASCNWWGDVSGPAAVDNVSGAGAALEGVAVYEPWLDGPSGACVLSSDYVYAGPAPSEINQCTDCVLIPVSLFRSDTNAARGVSVTFELSPELELCGAPTISLGAGTFYDGFAGQVQEFLLDNGGGSYTFDSSILGTPCGPTVGGEVFTIPVTYATGVTSDATGTVTISTVTLRDCDNAPLPALPGPGATVEIDLTAPAPVTNLVATQKLGGNDADGTTAIDLTWDLPADSDVTSMELYRKGFGFYPEYDDAGGAAPAAPTDPADALANGWVLAETLAPGATSVSTETTTRDFWYFVMFVKDECYTSAASDQTAGTLGYHLGDVAPGGGDNNVATIDISALGAAYGTVDGDGLYDARVDVGPTTDFSVSALPTTDDAIQFEDLMMFAINYGQVSRPVELDIAAVNEIVLQAPSALAEGERVSIPIRMAGDGTLQGVSVTVDWNRDVLEYVGYAEGGFGELNGAPVFSAGPGVIDAAVLGVGAQGLSGEGVLATLRFRVRGTGDPGLVIREVDARNGENERVTLDGRVIGDTPASSAIVRRSALRPNVPNPFNPRTTVFFDVAVAGRVDVRVYSLSGRLVRTLFTGDMTVGNHEVIWDGIDDAGRSVASGTYLVRLVAGDRTDSRSMVLLK